MKQRINIDMDGVVADWEQQAHNILGSGTLDLNGRWPDADWARLKACENFYRILPKTPWADDLIAVARRFRDELGWDLVFLTAIPHTNDVPQVYQDKIEWVQDYYPDIRVHFGPYSQDKQDHCRPGDILVDDRRDNCLQWRSRGGLTVEVLAGAQCVYALQDLFNHWRDIDS